MVFIFYIIVYTLTENEYIHFQILGGNHPLLDIVRECLSNVVDRRPTAVAILERIKELNTGGEREDDLMAMDMLHMMEQLQRVQEECELLQVSQCTVCINHVHLQHTCQENRIKCYSLDMCVVSLTAKQQIPTSIILCGCR